MTTTLTDATKREGYRAAVAQSDVAAKRGTNLLPDPDGAQRSFALCYAFASLGLALGDGDADMQRRDIRAYDMAMRAAGNGALRDYVEVVTADTERAYHEAVSAMLCVNCGEEVTSGREEDVHVHTGRAPCRPEDLLGSMADEQRAGVGYVACPIGQEQDHVAVDA